MSDNDVTHHADAEFPSRLLRELAATVPDDTVSVAGVERRIVRDRRRRRGARVAGGLTAAALAVTGLLILRPTGTNVTLTPAASPKPSTPPTTSCAASPSPASKANGKAVAGTAPPPTEETTKGEGVIQTVDNGIASVLVTIGPLAGEHLLTTSSTRLLPSATGCAVPSLVPGATVSFVADRTAAGKYVISALGRP
jgi:hypothetical protein